MRYLVASRAIVGTFTTRIRRPTVIAFWKACTASSPVAMSRHTSIGCEHRGGIGGTLFSLRLPIDLARLAVIDDQIQPEELHLLRLTPFAWLKTDVQTKFERMPTEFGPVTLRFQLQQGGKTLMVSFESRFRVAKQILLHVPPLDGLHEVVINGKSFPAKAGDLLVVEENRPHVEP